LTFSRQAIFVNIAVNTTAPDRHEDVAARNA